MIEPARIMHIKANLLPKKWSNAASKLGKLKLNSDLIDCEVINIPLKVTNIHIHININIHIHCEITNIH